MEETGYDNWNGGTTIWTIYLLLVPAAYARLASKREALEDQINKRLKPIFDQFTSDWYRVTIAPRVDPYPDWRQARDDVSRATRQNIIDGLKIDQVAWSGRLEDVELLQRSTISNRCHPMTIVSQTQPETYGSIVRTTRPIGRTTGSTTTRASTCCRVRRTPFFASCARRFIRLCVPTGTRR